MEGTLVKPCGDGFTKGNERVLHFIDLLDAQCRPPGIKKQSHF